MYLQLVLAGLSLRRRVEEINGQNLCTRSLLAFIPSPCHSLDGAEMYSSEPGTASSSISPSESVVCPSELSLRHQLFEWENAPFCRYLIANGLVLMIELFVDGSRSR